MSDLDAFADTAAVAETAQAMDDSHYRQAFGALCDEQVVRAGTAICAADGSTLVEKGHRIDRLLYARLAQQALREPLDQQLYIEGIVSADSLVQQATELLDTSTVPRLLAAALGHRSALLLPLREVPLPAPVALKLTLMRERSPELLQHALCTLLVALFLADRLELPTSARAHLAAAALLRDIGMLHIDPAWLLPQRRMDASERRHLHAHPIASMLMIRQLGSYAPEVATAVFEHHERLDGSGYPRGVRAAHISTLGQILLLAELVAALGQKFGDASPHRLGLVLRLNRRAFPIALIAQLLPALQGEPLPSAAQTEEAARKFTGIAGAFECWTELQGGLTPGVPGGPEYAWLNARLTGLRQSLTEAGGPPEEPNFLLDHGAGDELHVADALALGREALWQLGSICGDVLHRWPALAEASPRQTPGEAAVGQWCRWTGAMLTRLPAGTGQIGHPGHAGQTA